MAGQGCLFRTQSCFLARSLKIWIRFLVALSRPFFPFKPFERSLKYTGQPKITLIFDLRKNFACRGKAWYVPEMKAGIIGKEVFWDNKRVPGLPSCSLPFRLTPPSGNIPVTFPSFRSFIPLFNGAI